MLLFTPTQDLSKFFVNSTVTQNIELNTSTQRLSKLNFVFTHC